ncbi:MAG: S41 family peptidase [Bryobacteraceae bacterium]|nr:S41 family peptidase [Bryobacteraceae bacterium]
MLPLLAFLLLFSEEGLDSIDKALKRFVDLFAIVQANSADPVSPQQAIYEGAIPGMLRRLDPHSIFLDTSHFEQLKELEKSTQKGFGSIVSLLPGRVIVLQTLPGTPSARSGMSPGDEVVAINGIPLARLEIDQLVQLLTQSRQNTVRLDVRRQGNARLLPLTLTPEDVDSPSVDRAFFLQDGIAYLRVTSFEAETGQQIRNAMEKLGGADAVKGLVLDLRNNPGGILNAAVETTSLFLPPGAEIVSVNGRSTKRDTAKVAAEARPWTFPVAVLINGKSASASEIVAGALQDLKRATVIGEQSFGKGLVQSVFPLSQGAGLALTTAYYYTPSGRSIQRPLQGQLEQTTASGLGGINPDQVVFGEGSTRLRAFLDASAAFTTWATEWLQRAKPSITASFLVTNPTLDEFQAWLSGRNVRPGLNEWSSDREWIRSRLHQEIFNLTLGVAKGDEVEAARDPVVRAAVTAVTKP